MDLSRNHAVGREVVAKQIFAQGEACGARIASLDLTACAKRTSILGASPAEAWPANAPNDEVLAQKDRTNTTDPTAWLRLSRNHAIETQVVAQRILA